MIHRRIQLWENGFKADGDSFQALLQDLDDDPAARLPAMRTSTMRRCISTFRSGEAGQAVNSLLQHDQHKGAQFYSGPIDKVQELFHTDGESLPPCDASHPMATAPKLTPAAFYLAIQDIPKSSCVDATSWNAPWLRVINLKPAKEIRDEAGNITNLEESDPLRPLRLFIASIGAGSTSVSRDVYRMMAPVRQIVIKKKDGVRLRTLGIPHTLRRLGSRALARESKTGLNSFFFKEGQLAFSAAAADKIAWALTEATAKPGMVLAHSDQSSAFDHVRRTEVLHGIHELPANHSLRWLENALRAWYSEPVVYLSHAANGEVQKVYSMEGVTQGDPLGMILYCFGQVRALRDLRAKYPKATILAYADDVYMYFFGADITDPEQILKHWDKCATRKGGTKVNMGKCAVHRCSRGQADGTIWPAPPPTTGDRPLYVDGFLAMGVPVGTDTYVKKQAMELADSSAILSLRVAGTIHDSHGDVGRMCRMIALRLCVGIKRFQHILRVVPWRLAHEACVKIDSAMKGQLAALLRQARISDQTWKQATLRLSYGGFGITSASDIAAPAFLGGFHAAIEGEDELRLRDIVHPDHIFTCTLSPEGPTSSTTAPHQLSRLDDLRRAWAECVGEMPNLAEQARAALAGLNSPLHSSYDADREAAWVSEHLRGVKPSPDSSSADDDAEPVAPVAAPVSSSDAPPRRSGRSLRKIEEELTKRAKDAADDGLTASQAWQHPDSRMSAMIALGNWVTQKKLQRALTHERLKTRFIQFWDGLADQADDSAQTRESKSVARVRFRKVLNSVSHIPLAVFPSQGLTMRDPHYVWYLNDRIQTPQPEVRRLYDRGVFTCCKSNRKDDDTTSLHGRNRITDSHLQSCIVNRKCYHNKIRQEVFNMCNAANLGGVCVEKRGLIPGSRKKPADVYIGSWFLDEGYSACAIDIVTTDAEASLTKNTQASVRRQRENISGIQARKMDKIKRRKKLVEHDGEPTVQEYLKAREIKFVPFAVEGTGALGPAVSPFIKQVSQEAKNSGSCSSAPAFRRYWRTRLAMCLARERADAALDRVHDLCSKSNTTEGSSYVPLVDEYELVSEFDDLRGVVLRESSDESDDSADSEHSSDDDTASADSDGGSDSDESDGA